MKRTPKFSQVDYLDFLTGVVAALRARGVTETRLSRYELDMLNDSAERGVASEHIADWIIRDRGRVLLPAYDERDVMGSETVSPNEVAA